MVKNIQEQQLVIKWLMQDDKIIKFEELNETFDISDAVAKFDFEKAGIKGGSKVNVKIDKDQGDHGMVVFMTKVKVESTPSQNAGQASTNSGSIVKTVKAYGQKYSGSLLFTDNDTEWYSCDKSIGVENLPQYKDQTVEITTRTTEKGKKVVTSIKVVSTASVPTLTQSSSKVNNAYSVVPGDARQTSIEAQASVNSANQLVGKLFAGKVNASDPVDGELIKKLVRALAKNNWETIQELKAQA